MTSSTQQTDPQQTFVSILLLLGKITECVRSGDTVDKTTTLLRETVGLVSSLSVAILVPEQTQSRSRVTDASTRTSEDAANEDQAAGRRHSPTPTSPSSASATSPSPAHGNPHTTPGGPGSKTFSQHAHGGNRGLLTPPPSDGKQSTWANNAPVTRIPGTPAATPLANKGGVGLGLGLGANKEVGLELPLGFESSSDPTTSDSDFYLRAMYHRLAGSGIQEAYDATLKLSGATVLDGVLFRFKITDAYFNPETYNYSESLSRDDGFSGFRYCNKNGSNYIRFEEPTGPRISFVRHANPPYVIPYSSPSAHLRTPARSPAAASHLGGFPIDHLGRGGHHQLSSPSPHPYQHHALHQLRAGPNTGPPAAINGGGNKFSVQDFWN